ncbi:MAG TPA: prolyl oligopeptidase family serine peptidase [Planctomycetota bacterium]|jgi:dienelactone hydrolase|nr:prolyl oligopeptidase family serine peptidase [Planctomycetota bacterium]OQC19703.1 MAG: Alpha/beta hydrolase family protein [Planctomycetes bacterium ADurb.Bin069]HNR99870.1 prolyl oligopeptidase family serine peptidase [Planctomycetota bacterium]HNU25730.1 prolyl oligopeptidase family serine peptidase [Planctomycetota bacterium]HOE31357.1 prolyl oligopeptidase family serine peptidase [Planctomycetota bacterium]
MDGACPVLSLLLLGAAVFAQEYGAPDRGRPFDEPIQRALAEKAALLDARFLEGVSGAEDWTKVRPRLEEEYFYMLGLRPCPPRTPLNAAITRTLADAGFVVEMLHYQSLPRLYVTGNLYRPARATPGERLPAVLYLCGHFDAGRNGNKTAYQAHGIWFARHGYVCLMLDSLQLGEIRAVHHGTYRENRWWWHSRGYTPAGVECWNGIRGIDYLTSRPDVDGARIAVTGISGGGAASFWIAAADERVRAACPVSGMADLVSYVGNRVVNGHCDCMFLHNTFQWPWTRIAALIAPRPLLFVNSDKDAIFPMDANERISNRLERLYGFFGAGDEFDTLVSVGDHAYREDIRRGVYRFLNRHLKGDPRPVTDSEIDLVIEESGGRRHPIAPERLRVFPADSDLPKDELNTAIDRHFVPAARVAPPAASAFLPWKAALCAELRRVTFRGFETLPGAGGAPFVDLPLAPEALPVRTPAGEPRRILLAVPGPGDDATTPWITALGGREDAVRLLSGLRGQGSAGWTRKNPPNFVERSFALLGLTADTGRVWDVMKACRASSGGAPLWLAGRGPSGIIAAYAALWEDKAAGVMVFDPPASHMDPGAPAFLNVLRVCDIPEALGLLAPRPLVLRGAASALVERVRAIYRAAGAEAALDAADEGR